MILDHAPVPCQERCIRCGRWATAHASRWRRAWWRLTRRM